MKKIKAIILVLWFIVSLIIPFIFTFIDEVLILLNIFIPFILIISDEELRNMSF
jgi:hypothetical protein